MNRREFTKGLAAASLTPALPIKALGAAVPAAELAKDSMYIWANFVTRVHNKCSPDMLTRLLHIDPSHSAKLYAQLMADGAITAPNMFGLSQSTDPLHQKFATVTGHGPKGLSTVEKTGDSNPLKKALSDKEYPKEEVQLEADADTSEPDLVEIEDDSDQDFTPS